MTILQPWALFLLPLALVPAWLEWHGARQAARTRAAFTGRPAARPSLLPALFLFLCTATLLVALSRPVWNPRPVESSASGQDVVFLVDVSRSMETRDLDGRSRMEAVKEALGDLSTRLEGDRVALVAFAGTSVVRCPLTTDLGFFRSAVSLLDPGSASRGGTLLGDALRQVRSGFAAPGRELALWVFTDGGDQESFPVEAAASLADSGIRLVIWGVGTTAGGTVPERGVSSGLDETLLASVAAAAPGGLYYGAATPLWRLEEAYRAHRVRGRELSTTTLLYDEGAWWLLWPAGLFLAQALFARKEVP